MPQYDAKQPWLPSVSLLSAPTQRGRQSSGLWNSRLIELAGDARVSWYIVQPSPHIDLAYCVGYDNATKERLGYISEKGFHRAPPPREEWFSVTGGISGRVVGAYPGRTSAGTWSTSTRKWLPGLVLLATDDRIWTIFVVSRAVRGLFEAPNITSISATADDNPEVLVRTSSEVIAIDPNGRRRTSWKIPQTLRGETFQWYELADGNALAETVRQSPSDIHIAYSWVGRDGAITHTEQLDAHFGLPVGPRVEQLFWAAAAPSPLTFSFYSMIVLPLSAVRQGEQPDLPAAMSHTLRDAWPALLVVCLLSAALACLTYRRQTRYALPGAGLWAVFVFLLGVPGWLAYRWHRAWPLLKECGDCHRAAPRDREACAACGQLFAAPPLLGTEIFG